MYINLQILIVINTNYIPTKQYREWDLAKFLKYIYNNVCNISWKQII